MNEITWFDPKSGRTAVKDYPMTQQQIQAMLIQYRNNQRNQTTGTNTNAIDQPVSTSKKSKKGLVIGGVIVIILLILGFCTWQFKWYEIFTGKGGALGVVAEDPTIEPTSEPILIPTATLEPTLIPESPLGVLNEDYILIGNQEFLTSDSALFLESMNLSNSDLKSLQYMKNLDSLYLYDNNLTDLTYINNISTLTYLDVSKNDIYHINDIAMLTNLESLYLDDTKVSDLAPLSFMENLACLSIKNSEVFDLEPIVGIDSLMYLYVEGSLVDDFTYLDLMPNLYFCDSYITGGGTDLTPEPTIEPSDGYTFTEDDNLYLQPITDNYVVAALVPNSYEQIALVSFDENDTVVQMRLRMEIGYDLTEMDKETYLSYFKDTLGVDEITIVGSVIYVDYPEDGIDTYDREGFISDLELEGCEIIVDVKN